MWTMNSILGRRTAFSFVDKSKFKEDDQGHRDCYILVTNTSRPVVERHAATTRIANQNATKDLINYYYGRLNIIDVKIGQVLRFSTLAFGAAAFLSQRIFDVNDDRIFNVYLLGLGLLIISLGTSLFATMLHFQHMKRPTPEAHESLEECLKTYLDTMSAVTASRINILRVSLYSAIVGAAMILIDIACTPPFSQHLF